ncbi:MAG: LamG-like jellyroll fold domain-containing protein [Armatimonadota bacterium]
MILRQIVIGVISAIFGVIACSASSADEYAYWRFEQLPAGQPLQSLADESGSISLIHKQGIVASSDIVPMALIPGTNAANHGSIKLSGGYLAAKTSHFLNSRTFTVEMWARFGGSSSQAQVILSKGKPGSGNWHIIYQADGSVRANIYGGLEVYFFDGGAQGPVPGVWYHLAAVYEDLSNGKTRISTYVNGNLRNSKTGTALQDTSSGNLLIGSYDDGEVPFYGYIDELRFTPKVLKPNEMLIGQPSKIDVLSDTPKPLFVPAGTEIDQKLRTKASGQPIVAKPDGYPYFYKYINGLPAWFSLPDGKWDPGFRSAQMGLYAGASAGYHLYVKQGGKYTVAIGFYKPNSEKGKWPQKVVIDGKIVDTFDPSIEARDRPIVRIYEGEDLNRDGLMEVSCSHITDETGPVPIMNILWVFDRRYKDRINADSLVRGEYPVPPIYYVNCGNEEQLDGHVGYPELSAEARKKMLPERPLMFGKDPNLPQMPDPIDIDVRGDLGDRINTFMDRWGFAGRDQRLPAGFLSDCGFETPGRYLDVLSKLSRLTSRDLNLDVTFNALAEKQDHSTKYPGSLLGGTPVRTGFIWGQSTVFTGMMAYYDLTGDIEVLDVVDKLTDWYAAYLNNGDLAAANYFAEGSRFSREGATVGHLGKGALEAMVWLYWRTSNQKYLDLAKQIAELNRQWGGVAWMIHGDLPPDRQQYEGWHIHANLSTVRGFPWLYAATGDRRYLDDAIAACDRVYNRAMWGTGGVLEQIPWAGTEFPGATPDPHDETCQTSDLMQLSYMVSDLTGDLKYYERAEKIFVNHIRYEQMHNGSFCGFTRIVGPERGGDAWFCCGWWGAKALYETARHLYAYTPSDVYVKGFMPSSVNLHLKDCNVSINTSADIPKSGDIRIKVNPDHESAFDVNIRIPSWAILKSLNINGVKSNPQMKSGYAVISRTWKPGDKIDIRFDLPLRAELDSSWDTLPTAKVNLNGAEPVESRYVSVYRGPVIIARFALNHGCDLNWAYTGDHPDLFDTNNSCSDMIEGSDWQFQSDKSPSITNISSLADSVKIAWETSPSKGWMLKRSAIVRNCVPVKIDYSAELIAPSDSDAGSLKLSQLCGVRMRTAGHVDYTKAVLTSNGKKVKDNGSMEIPLTPGRAVIDNGYIKFQVKSGTGKMLGMSEGSRLGIYILPSVDGTTLRASYGLTITGKSRWAAPIIAPSEASTTEKD